MKKNISMLLVAIGCASLAHADWLDDLTQKAERATRVADAGLTKFSDSSDKALKVFESLRISVEQAEAQAAQLEGQAVALFEDIKRLADINDNQTTEINAGNVVGVVQMVQERLARVPGLVDQLYAIIGTATQMAQLPKTTLVALSDLMVALNVPQAQDAIGKVNGGIDIALDFVAQVTATQDRVHRLLGVLQMQVKRLVPIVTLLSGARTQSEVRVQSLMSDAAVLQAAEDKMQEAVTPVDMQESMPMLPEEIMVA